MKFFGAVKPAGDKPQAVPDDTWACRAQAGQVARGFVGLRLRVDGEVEQVAQAGKDLTRGEAKANPQLWWVREGRWPMQFAPQPEWAPEAGLALEIEPMASGGEYGALTRWLVSQQVAVTVATFAAPLREHPEVKTLPPCATPALLAEREFKLHVYAVGAFGVRVLHLRRVPLPPPVPSPAARLTAPQAAASSGVRTAAHTALDLAQAAWPTVVAQDQRACRRLAAELPMLDQRLNKLWGATGWSQTDMALFRQQQHVAQQLGLLAGKLGRPVSVAQRFAAGVGPTDAQRRLVAGAALRAEQALGDCWALLESLPAGQVPHATHMQALAQAVQRLEHEVNRRLRAWWELES